MKLEADRNPADDRQLVQLVAGPMQVLQFAWQGKQESESESRKVPRGHAMHLPMA